MNVHSFLDHRLARKGLLNFLLSGTADAHAAILAFLIPAVAAVRNRVRRKKLEAAQKNIILRHRELAAPNRNLHELVVRTIERRFNPTFPIHGQILSRKQGGIFLSFAKWWGERRGSNPRPPEPQSGALPAELRSPEEKSVLIIEFAGITVNTARTHPFRNPAAWIGSSGRNRKEVCRPAVKRTAEKRAGSRWLN